MCHTWTVSFFNKLRYLYFTTHKKSDSIGFLYLIYIFTKLFDYKKKIYTVKIIFYREKNYKCFTINYK